MLELRYHTPAAWKDLVVENLDAFLQDHAANERKVGHSALSLAVQHPGHTELVATLIDLAEEEMSHFRQVYDLLVARGQPLGQDLPDPYMGALLRGLRKRDVSEYLLDRLLVFGVVEARGYERFAMAAEALADDDVLGPFYLDLARSEARHRATYLRLARTYFTEAQTLPRLDELLEREAAIIADLPLRPALH